MTDPSTHGHSGPPPRFKRLFQLRLALLAVAFIANIILLAQLIEPVPGVLIFAIAVVSYAVLTIFLWKCPHCKKYPGNAVMPDYCEKCGQAIFGMDAHAPDLKPGSQPRLRLRYVLGGRTLYGLALLAYFIVFAPVQASSPIAFWSGAVSFVAIGAWLEWRWWRCPSCGGYLRRSIWPGKACTKCGEPFRY